MKHISLFLLFLVVSLGVNAAEQLKLHHKLEWNKEFLSLTVATSKIKKVPVFKGATHLEEFDHLPVFYTNVNLASAGDLKIVIANAIYEEIKNDNKLSSALILENITINKQIGYIKKRPVASVYFVPLRKNPTTGIVEKLIEFDLEVQVLPNSQQQSSKKRQSNYASNSVLKIGSGKWYKISVTADGVYKVDYNFLKSLGINVGNLDPKNIRVYGNGGGMLPEENADFRHDDLVENPIFVSGESDGSFDAGDFILFYGQGPHRWKYDNSIQQFRHAYNIYSDVTCYFINVEQKGNGKRWLNQPSISGANNTVTAFDDYAFHELEETNLIQSGRKWYGDYFNFNSTSRSFPFSFPNIIKTAPVYLESRVAGRTLSSTINLGYSANGQPVFNLPVNSVCSAYTCDFARDAGQSGTFLSTQDNINITIDFNSSSSAEAWLNYIELNARRSLRLSGSQMQFRDMDATGSGKISEYVLQNANANTKILDITNPVNVSLQQFTFNGNELKFTSNTETLKEYIAYSNTSGFKTPVFVKEIDNQNLHSIGQPDMIIVTHSSLLNNAETLANHHRTKDNLEVQIVDVQHIFNEFSSGVQDLSAIRDFVKMIYDRAGSNPSLDPQYLLLLGDGSFDYKERIPNNSNLIPTYESFNSVSVINSYNSDDYFGFLDDNEGGIFTSTSKPDLLDIAIGRIPVGTVTDAQNVINKIIHYTKQESHDSWRNIITFVADDEDGNIHLNQANKLAKFLEDNHKNYNIDKIFLDSYRQVSTPGGTRYPDVKAAINRRIGSGTLILNFTGHGGVNGWTLERILDINDVNSWENYDNLALFVTATCEFSKFDDPQKRSAGVQVLLNPKGGAIAMVTTVRLVFSGANFQLNDVFLRKAFPTPSQFPMPTIGESMTETKNDIPSSTNNRKFVLLGDPAVTLAYPKYDVVTTTINEQADDTLKALKKITITGEVKDVNGNKMTDFNGTAFPTIYDKTSKVTTLKNDGGSRVTTFDLQKNIIYRGQATVTSGEFSYTFIVPKDISYNIGEGKISYYAKTSGPDPIDANGFSIVTIGSSETDFEVDEKGPQLDLFMNDEKFAFGGTTDENPTLLVKLYDLSGINTVGTGIGHDITGVLDENIQDTYILNEYYTSLLDSYQVGKIEFPLSDLEPGRHSMKVKAWDVYNNSADEYIEFIVVNQGESITLSRLLNYPNPFTTNTSFHFEHNRPGELLNVQLKIMTVSGRVVKMISREILTEGFRVDGRLDDIEWDGLDEYGDLLGRGVYIYKLNVSTSDGSSAEEFEKLVILR